MRRASKPTMAIQEGLGGRKGGDPTPASVTGEGRHEHRSGRSSLERAEAAQQRQRQRLSSSEEVVREGSRILHSSTWTCNLQQIEVAQRQSRHLCLKPLPSRDGRASSAAPCPFRWPGGSCILRRPAEDGKGGSVSVARKSFLLQRVRRDPVRKRILSGKVLSLDAVFYVRPLVLKREERVGAACTSCTSCRARLTAKCGNNHQEAKQ